MKYKKILKAFECCSVTRSCDSCPAENDRDMCFGVDKQILDLIYKQKKEIEGLEAELAITRDYIHKNGLEWDLVSYLRKRVVKNSVDR